MAPTDFTPPVRPAAEVDAKKECDGTKGSTRTAAMAAAATNAANLEVEGLPWRTRLEFFVNGKQVVVEDAQPHHTLLWFLRNKLGLTGTKLGCGEGGCGACTVTVAQYDTRKQEVVHRSVNACLAPLCSVDGLAVTTVEGIGSAKAPHPVQQRIAELHGSQCGFCTPGIVMSLYSTLCKGGEPTLTDIESAFDGNLCRCTGYRPILDAAKTFACDKHKCPSTPAGFDAAADAAAEKEGDVKLCSSTSATLASISSAAGQGGAAERVMPFPQPLREARPGPLKISGARVTWYRPVDLASLLALKKAMPKAKLVAGNTEVGIETKFKHFEYPTMISSAAVSELHELSFDSSDGALLVGGAVTLSSVEHFLEKAVGERPQEQTRGLKAMLDMLRWFASGQIRNVAALAGNIVTASPISDMNPVLMALGASVVLVGAGTAPREVLVRDFFKSYRVVDMQPGEVLCSIRVPAPSSSYTFAKAFKQAKRRDDDISIVNACFQVELQPGKEGWTVSSFHTGFGGMAPSTVRAPNAEAALQGAPWSEASIEKALEGLAKDLPLPEGVPGGMAAYRQTLAASFLFKFYVGVSLELAEAAPRDKAGGLPGAPAITAAEASAARTFLSEDRPMTHGSQCFHVPSGGLQHSQAAGGNDHDAAEGEEQRAPVGQPMRHRSALPQCTGEATYVDDIPAPPGCLHAAFVLSEKPHARLLSVDTSAALAAPGVAGIFTAADLSEEENRWGPIFHDELLFRKDTVTSTGQLIALVAASSLEEAERAARLVKVQYEELPAVLTIDDAIRAESFHKPSRFMEDGDVEAAFALPDTVIVEGEFRVGGQEHFYLETNCCLVQPGEGDELTIHTSTQNPMKTQKFAAHACGIPFNRVTARMKRMGGGFGGKETRTVFISSAVAFAAHRLHRPVRVNVERDQDMWITGARHPFLGKYKAGAGPDGKLRALDLKLYSNAGYSMDLSGPILDRALFHSDNVYKIPNLRGTGHICITNTTSNTAFRGFGGPQGLIICEYWMDHLATALGMRPEQLRARNLYAFEGDRTHFFQPLLKCPVQRMWRELAESAELERRTAAVDEFNKENRWRKRGLALIPTKFGISFTAKFMNQAGALVHIYTDGTVLVTHGGTEMGQGLHTKMIQVAARALGVSSDDVYIRETSTDTVPNSSPTAASASSDMYGMAILNACEQLQARLKPYLEAASGNFKKAVSAAFFDRCDLSAHGFYKTPNINYDWAIENCAERGSRPFNYFTYGAACSEVEVDVLTGDMRILRADILMDLGNSLNPAIDIGQIEGAFTQGVGWTMTEEMVWGCDQFPWLKPGTCFTRGPGAYKIPSFNDVPVDLRVTLFKDSANPLAIHSSRAVGEPPLFLGASAFFATRRAIASARADAGQPGEHFFVDSPLTPERIRMACADKLAVPFAAQCSRPRPSGFW